MAAHWHNTPTPHPPSPAGPAPAFWRACRPCSQALYPALYLGFYYALTVFETPFYLYYIVLALVAW